MAINKTSYGDNRRWLYDTLSKRGAKLGDYETFNSQMDKPDIRKWAYATGTKLGLRLGDEDTYNKAMMPDFTETKAEMNPVSTIAAAPEKDQQSYAASTPAVATPQVTTTPEVSTYKDSPQYKAEKMQQLNRKPTEPVEPVNTPSNTNVAASFPLKKEVSTMPDKYDTAKPAETKETVAPIDMSVSHYEDSPQYKAQKLFDDKPNPVLEKKGEKKSEAQTRLEEQRSDVNGLYDKITNRLNQIYDEDLKAYNESRKNVGAGVKLADALMAAANPVGNAYINDLERATIKDQGRIQALQAGKDALDRARQVMSEADRAINEGNYNGWQKSFVSGALRGIGQGLFDVRTWTSLDEFGAASAQMIALNKADKGEELTQEEMDMLDALSMEMAVNAYFGSNVGRGYKAGKVTAESLPFMLEMLINPASTLGEASASKLARYAMRRFGKKAAAKAVGVAGKVAGDIAGAAAMAATTGAVSTAAGTMQRMNEGESFWPAFAKEFGSQTIERLSEFQGEYFSPITQAIGKVGGKAANKVGKAILSDNSLSKIDKFLKSISDSKAVKRVDDFFDKTKWNGVFGEYGEEVLGGIENAILVGDQTLDTNPETGVFNLDNNIDTFLGVGLMGGFASILKTGAYGVERTRLASARNTADKVASGVLGENWESMRSAIDEAIDKGESAAVIELYKQQGGEKQKKALLGYAKARSMQEGAERAYSEIMKNAAVDDLYQLMQNAEYENGYNMETPQEQTDAMARLQVATERMQKATGLKPEDASIEEVNAVDAIDENNSSPRYNQEQKQSILDYLNAKEAVSGMEQRTADDINAAVAESDAMIDANVNSDTQMLQPATLVTDKKVHIISGRVSMLDDGTSVDTKNSSESIIIRHDDTGKLEMVSPGVIASMDAPIDAEQTKAQARKEIEDRMNAEAEAKKSGKLQFAAGDKYNLLNNQGGTVQVEVVADENGNTVDEQGNVHILVNDEVASAPAEQLQQMSDAETRKRVEETIAPEPVQAPSQDTQGLVSFGDIIQITTPEGETIRGQVNSNIEDGKYEVVFERPVGGKRVTRMSEQELTDMGAEKIGEIPEDLNKPKQETQQAESEPARVDVPAAEEQSVQEPAEPQTETAPVEAPQPETALGRIPKDSMGNPDYTHTDTKTAYDALIEEAGDEQTAQTVAEQMVEEKTKALEEAQNAKPQAGATVQEKIAAEKARKEAIANAQNELDAWKAIAAEKEARKQETEKPAEEEQISEEQGAQVQEETNSAAQTEMPESESNVSPEDNNVQPETPAVEPVKEEQQLANIEPNTPEEQFARGQQILEEAGKDFMAYSTLHSGKHLSAEEYKAAREKSIAELAKLDNDVLAKLKKQKGISTLGEALIDSALKLGQAEETAMAQTETSTHYDKQGNEVDADGKLIVEEVQSVDEITDEDFSSPTRSVQLPKLPDNVDAAIGAKGKPVIIKKNIFEKNLRAHKDLTPAQSRDILTTALYSPNLYGQSQKVTRPYNWVVINTKEDNGDNRIILLEVSEQKDNVEIVNWHYLRDKALETLKRQAEREGGLILILPSDTEEAGGLSGRPSSLSSEGKDTNSSEENKSEGRIVGTAPRVKRKLNLFKYINPYDIRPALTGVYHDKGMQVATDTHILVALEESYPEELEGKSTGKDNSVIAGTFPNWRAIEKQSLDNWYPIDVDLDDLAAFIAGVKDRLKKQAVDKRMRDRSEIILKGNRESKIFNTNGLEKFVEAARSIGGNIGFSGNFLVSFNGNNLVVLIGNNFRDAMAFDYASGYELDENNRPIDSEGNPIDNGEVRYQKANDKNLIAVHNISEKDLAEAFELGGFPMPSIAITKADVGHTNFGEISLVFEKATINPKSRKNKVYSGDAWTPMFPKIGYKINTDKAGKIYGRAANIGGLPMFNSTNFYPVNYEGNIEDLEGKSLVEHFRNDYGAKQFFLAEQGNPVTEYETKTVDKYNEQAVARFEELLKSVGLEKLKQESREISPETVQVVRDFFSGGLIPLNDDALKRVALKYVLGVIDYAENGNQKQETDIEATKKKIDERINKDAYEKWLEDMFSGIVEKRGIRNQTDMFTPIGNRRAWESLYDEVTLDNVVKAMSKAPEKGGSGIFNGSIFGAASGEFKSIDEIRAAAQERIQSVDPDEMEKERQAILNRLSKVKVTEKELGIGEMFELTTNIKDAVAQSHTPEGIHKYLKEYYPDMTMQAAQEIADIVKDIQKLSTKYFEAKPYRAVGFDEVKLAVVPEGTSQDVIDNLRQRGIEVRTYEAGNQQQRKEIVDQAAGELSLKFDKSAQGAVPLTEDEAALRDTLVDTLNASGIETISDTESGQRVLDKANGLERQAKKKALETASLDESRSLTVVSSADGAKVLKNIDDLQQTLQESTTQPKTFIGDVAMALGAKRDGSGSEYATFETVNGKIVTIRLSNHNAKVSNFDNREEAEGISIVISPKPNQGMINDGNAHIVEYYYNAIKLRKAEGKPLADIVKSIKQALYSGEFKDTTGLAKRKEVNESNPRLQKVYHGSGANFNAFDHKYMGSGEGTQAYGYGTYVTEVEGIGKHYANVSTGNRQKENRDGLIDQKERLQAIRDGYLEKIKHYEEMAEKFAGTDREKRHKKFAEAFRYMLETGDYKYDPEAQQVSDNIKWRESQLDIEGKRLLYSVEIPDDNGENYITYERTLPKKSRRIIAEALRSLPESELSRANHGPNWLPDGWNTLANTIEREQYAGKEIRERLADAFGSEKKVSEFLNKIGFVGFSVPVNNRSWGKTDAARNFVIFNEKDLQITDKVQFFKTPDGHAYGFTVGGKIYIDPRIASAETPIHEYTHLWAAAMRQLNPKEWENIVSLMKDTPIWESIKQQYPELTSDEEIADEVLANYSGSRGAQRLREAQQKVAEENIDLMGKARAISAIERVKDALKRFWNGVADFFGIHFTTAEEVADKIMSDMLNGVNPTEYARENNLKYDENTDIRYQFIGEKGAAAADKAEEGTVRLDNLAVAREMETAGKDARTIKMATGWERGADGKWRYEIPDGKLDLKSISEKDTYTLEMIWDDKELFKAYPELKKIEVRPFFAVLSPMVGGYTEIKYNESEKGRILINTAKDFLDKYPTLDDYRKSLEKRKKKYEKMLQEDGENEMLLEINKMYEERIENAKDTYDKNMQMYNKANSVFERYFSLNTARLSDGQEDFTRKVLAHEIQHAIQIIEGFAVGGNTNQIQSLFERAKAEEQARIWARHIKEEVKDNPNKTPIKILNALKKEYQDSALGMMFPDYSDAMDKGFNYYVRGYADKSMDELIKKFKLDVSTGSDFDAYTAYRQIAGEVESRNVENRLNMSIEDRRKSLLSETEDVARKDQIFLYEALNQEYQFKPNKGYTNVDGINMSVNAERAIADGMTDIGVDPMLGRFIEQNGYGEYDGEYHHIGQKYNTHYFARLNEGVTLAAVRKAYKQYKQENVDKQVATLLEEYPDAFSVDNLPQDKEFYKNNKNVAFIGGKYWYVPRTSLNELSEWEAKEATVKYSRVTDKETLDRLNNEPTIKTYRAMQLRDGVLYPPMAGKVDGKWNGGIAVDELGMVWEQSDERPDLVDDKGNFTLNKGNGTSLKARYNPYIHTSTTPLNDQFSSAQDRPELVTVEVEVPESELSSGYKAEKAKDAVGKVEWKAGVIQAKLSGTRTVILSRWDRPMRVVPDSEVADVIVKMFEGKNITMPSNVVTPSLRAELEKRGVPFIETDNRGKEIKKAKSDTLFREGTETASENTEEQMRKTRESADELAQSLGAPVEYIENLDDIQDENEERLAKKRNSKGWYDTETGKVYVVLPNAEGPADARRTIFHEIMGHKNLHEMLGKDEYDALMDKIYASADSSIREKIVQIAMRNGWSFRKATEEYMAGVAEEGFDDYMHRNLLQKIKGLITDAFRNIKSALGFKLSDADVRYLLWKTYSGRKQGLLGVAEDVLFRQRNESYEDATRITNNKGEISAFANFGNRIREAYQDSMLSLKKFQDEIVRTSGKQLEDYENAYSAENAMSSKNRAEAEQYDKKFFTPIKDAVAKLMGDSSEWRYDEITKYMIAKHGLERNRVFAERDRARGEEPKEDYSGLKGLFPETDEFTQAAEAFVEFFEEENDTTELWDAVNAATKQTLKHDFESGLISKETYEYLQGMFEYYIPLRGWEEDNADERYEYLRKDKPLFEKAVKKAKGRTSVAKDPIATIAYLANSSIALGNRNLMKQKFLNMLLNNPTPLASVSERWYVLQEDGTYLETKPDIPVDATPEEIANITNDFIAKMSELRKQQKAVTRRQGLKLNLHLTNSEAREHEVHVNMAGKEYIIYINGNPRVAQALNGMTNPAAIDNKLVQIVKQVNNYLARVLTTQNPSFILTNLSRDFVWASTSVSVKEDMDYTKKYANNIAEIMFKGKMFKLVKAFENDTLDTNDQYEKYFKEFIMNGGETGFTNTNTIDDFRRDIDKYVKTMQKGKMEKMPEKIWNGIWDSIEYLNRCAEDITRFSVYVTSRQQGRSIQRSVSDAKDITVNFNKKGSGQYGNVIATSCYLFFNAAVQSINNMMNLFKTNPKKMTATTAAFIAAGALQPFINAIVKSMVQGDDDDDEYYDLPDNVRRNNIVIPVPFIKRMFITIPLPHELRPFYALGEIASSCAAGMTDVEDGMKECILGFSAMAPIDFTGNDANALINLTPTSLQPFAQLIANTDYFGRPIYKDTPYNQLDPNWTKAYRGTNSLLVNGSRMLNELSGGDNVEKGAIDLNPAAIEYLFEQYLGGVGKTINGMGKTISMLWNEDNRLVRNVPVVKSFIQSSNDRTGGRKVNEDYFNYLDDVKKVEHTVSGYRKQIKQGNGEYADKLKQYMQSDEYRTYVATKKYIDAISKLNKSVTDENRAEVEKKVAELKAEVVAIVRGKEKDKE